MLGRDLVVAVEELAPVDRDLVVAVLDPSTLPWSWPWSDAGRYNRTDVRRCRTGVNMGQVLAQADQDAAIWTEWVNGSTQDEIARRRGVAQSTISAAIRRYRATVPEEEKAAHRERALSRLEELYAAHRERALTSTRAASLVARIIALEARLLGIEAPTQVEVDAPTWSSTPEPDSVPPMRVAELLDQWRRDGRLRVRGELVRLDQEAGP